MGRSLGLTLALAGTLAMVGCGDSPVNGVVVGGNGTVIMTVSSGVTPTISWTGGNARRLTITRSGGGGIFWDIEALNANGFGPPVIHGIVPTGARESTADVQLIQGTDFRVNVSLVDGTEGTRVFRP